MNELALFAGAGGGILGGKLLGWRTVCAVECDAYAAALLAQRQNDGCLEPFPIWSDVETFDGKPWEGIVDVVSGGFPCQDISCAGNGEGLSGKRSGLWSEMARIVGEIRPKYIIVENSPMLTIRGFGTVLGDLAEMGFNARWGVLGADAAGLPHRRARIWVVANNTNSRPLWRHGAQTNVGENIRGRDWKQDFQRSCRDIIAGRFHRVAERVDRVRAIGNGQVPAVVRLAWEILGPAELERQ